MEPALFTPHLATQLGLPPVAKVGTEALPATPADASLHAGLEEIGHTLRAPFLALLFLRRRLGDRESDGEKHGQQKTGAANHFATSLIVCCVVPCATRCG
jgi:hypothetical protein